MSNKTTLNSSATAEAKRRVGAKLGVIWWAIFLRGILALTLALCAFVWPEQTLGLLIKLLGLYFLLDGVIGGISAYRSGDKLSPVVQAIVSLTIGLVLLLWTEVSGKVFLILVGVWLILQGAGLTVAAFRIESGDVRRTLTMVIGGTMA